MPGKPKQSPPENSSTYARAVWDFAREKEDEPWSQAKLGKEVGVSQSTIHRLFKEQNYEYSIKLGDIIDIYRHTKILPPFGADALENKIISQLSDIDTEDKITLLRIILRLKNSAKKASAIIRKILKSV